MSNSEKYVASSDIKLAFRFLVAGVLLSKALLPVSSPNFAIPETSRSSGSGAAGLVASPGGVTDFGGPGGSLLLRFPCTAFASTYE